MSIIVLDLETSINSEKHSAQAKDPCNDFHTIIHGTKSNVMVEHSVEGFKRRTTKSFNDSLKTTKMIVGHNLSFDLPYVWDNEEFQEWLVNWGVVWDTQLVQYLMSGQRHAFPSLGELQKIYLKRKIKEDRISKLYKKGIGADKILAARERCPRLFKLYDKYSRDDGETTLAVFEKQVREAKRLNMIPIIKVFNKYLLTLVLCMKTGIVVDRNTTEKNLRDFKLKALDLLAEAQELIKHLWSDERLPEFNVNSPQHKSAILFGGDIRCKVRKHVGWVKSKVKIRANSGEEFDNFQQFSKHYKNSAIEKNLAVIEFNQVCTHICNGCFEYSEYDGEEDEVDCNCIYKSVKSINYVDCLPPDDILKNGVLNLGSDVYKITNRKDKYKTKEELVHVDGFGLSLDYTEESKIEGRYATGGDVISKIIKTCDNEIAVKYCKLQKESMNMMKMCSTYLEAFLDLSIDGKLLPNFNITKTSTSRLSSSNPNLQNVVSKGEIATAIQECFIAPDGWSCCSIDFSQLEIYVTAWLTGDEAMTKDLLDGVCFHCLRLSWASSMSEGKSYEEIVQLAKIDEVPEWTLKRSKAKTISYQKAYGAGAKSLAESTGLHIDDVKELLDKEDKIYYRVKAFNDYVYQQVENTAEYSHKDYTPALLKKGGKNGKRFDKSGYELLPIKHGNNTYFEEGNLRNVGYFQSITGKRYAFEEFAIVDKQGKTRRTFSPTQTKNYQIQGTASDVQAITTAALLPLLLKHSDKVMFINEIHDSKVFYVKDGYLDLIVNKLCEIMEATPQLFKKYLNIDMPFSIPVDAEVGKNLASLQTYRRK